MLRVKAKPFQDNLKAPKVSNTTLKYHRDTFLDVDRNTDDFNNENKRKAMGLWIKLEQSYVKLTVCL